jgi:hypothetical protein
MAGGQADQQDGSRVCRLHWRRVEEGGQQEIVPNAVAQHRARVIDAVDAHPFVELEVALAPPLAHGDIVVLALVLEEDGPGLAVIPSRPHGSRVGQQGHGQYNRRQSPRRPSLPVSLPPGLLVSPAAHHNQQ